MEEVERLVKKYFEFVSEKKFMGLKCKSCGAYILPPKSICKKCGSKEFEWVEFSGKGSLHTFTVIHVAAKRFLNDAPFVVGVVQLEEGPRIMARIVGVDPNKPETIKTGMPLKVTFIESDEKVLLAFEPEK
nr:Zn-ribbon domain-containing OB-fold protein [Candidatus Baldrarchaeota archaeon]